MASRGGVDLWGRQSGGVYLETHSLYRLVLPDGVPGDREAGRLVESGREGGWPGLLTAPGAGKGSWRGCGAQGLGEFGGAAGLGRACAGNSTGRLDHSVSLGSGSALPFKEGGSASGFLYTEGDGNWGQIPPSGRPVQRGARDGDCIGAVCGCHAVPPTVSKVAALRVLIPQENPVPPRSLGQGSLPSQVRRC